MKNIELKVLRCSCGKLLARSNGWIEIKCPRCKKTIVFENGKILDSVTEGK